MAYDGRVLRRARERFEADRAERQRRFEDRRESLYRRQGRLRQIDEDLRSTTGRILAAALRRGTDPGPALAELRRENLRLQQERTELLAGLGVPADALEERPACALCGDSGYRDGRMCRCLRDYYAKEQQKELSRMLDLGSQSFDTFSLDWYSERYDAVNGQSPRANMERVYDVCADFAYHFGRRPGNLLLFGAPGLGKTFLSAAIAREVSAKGFSVVYDTAGRVFSRFEARKFSREDEEAEEDTARVLECDLLILDDLGTEMTTAFVQSALYEIVNTRLVERRSTIVSTNLTPGEIARRYSGQVASRLEGEYQILPFFGEDIRKLKKAQGGGF